MIQTSIGTVQVGSPWLSRQWINTIPGVEVTAGITQNNLTIRAGHNRPSFTPGQPLTATSGSTPQPINSSDIPTIQGLMDNINISNIKNLLSLTNITSIQQLIGLSDISSLPSTSNDGGGSTYFV